MSSLLKDSTKHPSFIIPIWVAICLARKISWVAISVAIPLFLRVNSKVENSLLALGSNPDVGSSKSNTLASLAKNCNDIFTAKILYGKKIGTDNEGDNILSYYVEISFAISLILSN